MLTHEGMNVIDSVELVFLEHELNVHSEKHLSLLEPLTDHYIGDEDIRTSHVAGSHATVVTKTGNQA